MEIVQTEEKSWECGNKQISIYLQECNFSQPSLQNTSAGNSEGRAQHCQIFVWGFVTKENELLFLMKHLITFWIRTKWKAPVILKAYQKHIKTYVIQTMNLHLCVCLSATLKIQGHTQLDKIPKIFALTKSQDVSTEGENSDIFAICLDGNRTGRWCYTRSPAFPFG